MWCPVGESGSTHAKLRCRESLEPGIGQERCYPRESGEKKLKGKDDLKERGPWRKREVQWYLSVGRVAGVKEWKGLGGCLEDMTGKDADADAWLMLCPTDRQSARVPECPSAQRPPETRHKRAAFSPLLICYYSSSPRAICLRSRCSP
jgi:hypothetical protein